MTKLKKDFFSDELLFVGYSARNKGFSNKIYQTFSDNGIRVYPMNNKENNYDVKVYQTMEDLPTVPECAYVLLNKDNTKQVVKELVDNGVKKILFHNKKIVDSETLEECSKQGIETAVACPMMIFGSGIHKIHAFFAGV
ncbi:MAG: CoA-binding protein [Halanaerobiales bacterium]